MSTPNLFTITFPQSKFETIGPDSLCWSQPDVVSIWYGEGTPRPDYVRLQPPADASEALLEQVKAQFEHWGIVVKVNKRENRKRTVTSEKIEPVVRRTARQVVMDKIQASNSSNKKLLTTICENAMAEYKV